MEKDEEPGQKDQSRNSRAWQQKIWALFDNPYLSIAAKVIAIVSLIFIMISVTVLSLQTLDFLKSEKYEHFDPVLLSNSSMYFMENHYVVITELDMVELVCSIWFVFEFVMLAVSCPSKRRFFMNVMNVVDLLAVFPSLLRWCSSVYCWKVMGFLHIMRCIRLFHIFKLMQHAFGVRVLNHVLRASVTTLCTVPLILLFICTLFIGTMLYYAEFDYDESYFADIPSCFWWVVATLTAVIYVDVVHIIFQGRVVSLLCAVTGFLLFILPVPIIVNNYIKFSSLIKTKYSMPRKKERSIVDTAPLSSA